MTKQDILRIFLEHPYFSENNIVKEENIDQIKWDDPINNKLIDVLKRIIDDVVEERRDRPNQSMMNYIDSMQWESEHQNDN